MYHGISDPKRNGAHPYYETSTSLPVFIEQMRVLKENGYKTIGLGDLPDAFTGKWNNFEKFVVITFDDGLLDFYVTGFSILKAMGFTATVFLPTGLMGQTLANQPVMSWQNARELAAEGVEFGSHSVSHPKMVDLDRDRLDNEIMQSKKIIEDELGREAVSFSFPYAFPEQNRPFVKNLSKLLKNSGYRVGVTTKIGRASKQENLLFLSRLPVNDYDDIPLFKAKIGGGYDWLHAGQNVFKKTKNFMKVH
jgi:peptidoglycan/xylan/chitin deacetylase (PgdA/CDA1 family)